MPPELKEPKHSTGSKRFAKWQSRLVSVFVKERKLSNKSSATTSSRFLDLMRKETGNTQFQVPRSPRRYLSLKWKILLRLGMLFALINLAIIFPTQNQLEGQLERQLAESVSNRSLSLLEQAKKHLTEMGSIIPIAAGVVDTDTISPATIEGRLDDNWELMQLDYGVESFSVFTLEGQAVMNRGEITDIFPMMHLVKQLAEGKKEGTTIYCGVSCRLYAALPFRFHNGKILAIILSRSLNDFILEFSVDNNIDVMLLRPSNFRSGTDRVRGWSQDIVSSTDRTKNQSLIDTVAEEITFEDFVSNGYSQVTVDGRDYYAHAIKLNEQSVEEHAYMVFINDITQQSLAVEQSTQRTVALFVVGLIISALGIVAVVWYPMERMNKLAYLLPLLAQGGFEKVREQLALERSEAHLDDELDVLNDTAVSLSNQLEKMDQEIRRRTHELEYMALYDVLTGLANRRLYTDYLIKCIAEFHRYGKRFAVVFIDLDNFKRVNDSLGHDAGDELLIEVARRLSNNVRESDVVARLGGDEFTLLLPHVKNNEDISNIMQTILDSFKRPINLSGNQVSITPSMGIAVGPDNGLEAQQLMRCADLAMYQAKQEGKNNFHFFTEEMANEAQSILRIEYELREALDERQFVLVFQPIVDLKQKRIVSFEALVRWDNPELGVVGPAEFVEVMENNGQIIELGDQVLEMVGDGLRQLKRLGYGDISVSVNVSSRQLSDESLYDKVKSVIDRAGVTPKHLTIEITESALMDDIEQSISLLNRLKSLGVGLSIDDFGTGYASLNYLKRLPVDELKVDREFLIDIPRDQNNMEIASAVIAMAHKLHLTVVAEGVENQDQLDFLIKHGCDYGQGFFFDRPATLESYATTLMLRKAL